MSLSKMLQEYREGLRGLPTYEELAAIASSEQCADPIVERNVSLLRQRSTVGAQKYGATLADNKLPLRALLNHALEEALDQANYLQAAMAEIDSAAPQVQAYRNDPVVQGMADCMDMVRQELIEAGVIGADVAPMFIANAVVAKLASPMQAQEPVAYTAGSHDIFDLIREWAHKPEGNRYEAARKIIGYINSTYTAGVNDGKFLGATAAPAAQGDAKELTNAQIAEAVRSVGVDTHPSKFGFADEQIEGMSVTVLRQVIAAIATKSASTPQ